ncbi:MAG TPA: DUF1343 domain-containing protein [Bacteroidales bacterium]|nr:DUF1343 domain-containing protein [Bacteroidales bacterium]
MPGFLIILLFVLFGSCHGSNQKNDNLQPIVTGAERTQIYLPQLRGRKVALVANHTSVIGSTHLVDSLLALGVDVKKVFAPEHGFRGEAEDGAHIASGIDSKTGVMVVSVYGQKRKPAPDDLKDIDIVIFDIQEVGARFYTFISTMSLAMEACAEIGIPFMVFDRPNPNGFYVDGPVLETEFSSFVGMHPVPVVHGMTVGEYAQMLIGEGWLAGGIRCELFVVPMLNYHHQILYELPVRPSPNLPDMASVYLYPSLCFFEGTIISVGRGTDKPFRIIGHPDYAIGNYTFTPQKIPGASVNPPHKGQLCKGFDLSYLADSILVHKQLNLQPLIDAWNYFQDHEKFFSNYFDRLAGTSSLRKQIMQGMSEDEIRESWQADLKKFEALRKKYLIY